MAEAQTFLLVGLGNPGDKYESTRHNVGFWVTDELAKSWGCVFTGEKWEAQIGRGQRCGASLILIKPHTYMNLSGRAVQPCAHFYKVAPDHIIVLHDDLDMPLGRLKLVFGGGAGGHKGIQSITQLLGSSDYYRMKICIGRPGTDGISEVIPIERFVLSPFSADALHLLRQRFVHIGEGLEFLFSGQSAKAFNLINSCK